MTVDVVEGDCLTVLPTLGTHTFAAIVTDPPAGISFMGKVWDHDKGGRDQWIAWMQQIAAECLRVVKPGGHALVWALPRTSHWTATAWENAGWTVRDRVAHLVGSGFPKGLNVVNQLIKLALWQLPDNVLCAAQASQSIRVISNGAKDSIAVALVQILPGGGLELLTEIGGEVALHVPTDTWPSEWMGRIGLSTTWSWNGSLEDASAGMSKCITSIRKEAELTIDQKTYNWLIGLRTSGITMRCNVILQNGLSWPALTAESHSSGDGGSKKDILLVSVLGDAIWQPLRCYAGFNVSLKPACEDWWLLRAPLSERTVAANVLRHGTGALNIDASRVACEERPLLEHTGRDGKVYSGGLEGSRAIGRTTIGRYPANVVHDGSDEVLAAFAAFGERISGSRQAGGYGVAGSETVYGDRGDADMPALTGSTGTAARFFYSAKAAAADRADSRHPTVKPVDLIRYLVRLVTPSGGQVLDPFAGSGTTAEACMLLGYDCTLIERDPQHAADIRHRIKRWSGLDAPLFAEAAN